MILGSALDIMTVGRPPRMMFLNYPLGHSAGQPNNFVEQVSIVHQALQGLEAITEPETVIRLDLDWDADPNWELKAGDPSAGDTRQPRDETPQWQFDADRVAARTA